jgi:hypothetical protein
MMSANNNEPDDDTMVCCASCGVAEVDDIKLKKVALAILFDIAVLPIRKIIGRNTNEHARRGWLNYAMGFYSGSLKAPISGTVRFVYCHYRLLQENVKFKHVAAKLFA